MVDLEKKLLVLLSDFCDQNVSLDTNLFWSGLNSLNFIVLVTRLEKEFQFHFLDIDLELSNFKTPKNMIAVINKYLT